MATVRPYNTKDKSAVREICLETGPSNARDRIWRPCFWPVIAITT